MEFLHAFLKRHFAGNSVLAWRKVGYCPSLTSNPSNERNRQECQQHTGSCEVSYSARAHRTRATVPLAGKQEAIVKRGKCERTTAWTKSQVLALRWLVRAVFTWPIVTYNDQWQQPIYWTNQILQQIRVGDVKCEKSCAAKSTTDFGLAPDWLKNWCEGFLNNCY